MFDEELLAGFDGPYNKVTSSIKLDSCSLNHLKNKVGSGSSLRLRHTLLIIPPTCSMLIAQGTFSMLVMVEIADQTALWCARGQRMMATRVRTFMYFTVKEKKTNT